LENEKDLLLNIEKTAKDKILKLEKKYALIEQEDC
jgi:hypothetical protein